METQEILKERNKTHGDWFEQSMLAQTLKEEIRHTKNWLDEDKLSFSQQESLDMIMHKISRILVGDPNCADHWADIAGYAKLVENQITNYAN